MWRFPLYAGLPGFDLITSEIFSVPLNNLNNSVKTAESSPARAHRGANQGTWSLDPEPPPWVRGCMYKKKVVQDPGPNPHTAAAIRKEVLTRLPPPHTHPTPPHPHKRGPGYGGGGGSKTKNSLGDHFLSQNEDFTRGSDIRYHNLGYTTRTTSKGGGGEDARTCA